MLTNFFIRSRVKIGPAFQHWRQRNNIRTISDSSKTIALQYCRVVAKIVASAQHWKNLGIFGHCHKKACGASARIAGLILYLKPGRYLYVYPVRYRYPDQTSLLNTYQDKKSFKSRICVLCTGAYIYHLTVFVKNLNFFRHSQNRLSLPLVTCSSLFT